MFREGEHRDGTCDVLLLLLLLLLMAMTMTTTMVTGRCCLGQSGCGRCRRREVGAGGQMEGRRSERRGEGGGEGGSGRGRARADKRL